MAVHSRAPAWVLQILDEVSRRAIASNEGIVCEGLDIIGEGLEGVVKNRDAVEGLGVGAVGWAAISIGAVGDAVIVRGLGAVFILVAVQYQNGEVKKRHS